MTSSFVSQQQQSDQEDTRGEPMQLDTLRMTGDNAPTPVQIGAFRTKTSPSKKLTGEERAHLRSTNACFKYRKQGHLARDCPTETSYPDSKKPRPPVDLNISAGQSLEIAPTILASPLFDAPTTPVTNGMNNITNPVTTLVIEAASKPGYPVDELDNVDNGEPDNLDDDESDTLAKPDNLVDEPVNPEEESDILNEEEPDVSNERKPVKPEAPDTLITSITTTRNSVTSTLNAEEPVTTPVMASTPVNNPDDSLVISRHPDPRVKLGYLGINDKPEEVKPPMVYGNIDERIAQITLDSGCSTYMLSTDFANAGNIPCFPCEPVPVELAVLNASQFTLDTQTKKLSMEIGSITQSKAAYVLPLPSCDAIFGMPFLNGRKLSNLPRKDIVTLDDMKLPLVKDHDERPCISTFPCSQYKTKSIERNETLENLDQGQSPNWLDYR